MGQKKFSPENLAVSGKTSYEFLAPCQISEKTNDTVSRKHVDRRTEEQKDGQILFYRTLLTITEGPIIEVKCPSKAVGILSAVTLLLIACNLRIAFQNSNLEGW